MEPEIYREARRRVDEKAKFYKHLFFYLAFNGIFMVIAIFGRGRPFPLFPVAFFWGLGVVFHYLRVFGFPGSGILSETWKDKEIKKEMDRLRSQREMPSKEEELQLKELRKNYDESELV